MSVKVKALTRTQRTTSLISLSLALLLLAPFQESISFPAIASSRGKKQADAQPTPAASSNLADDDETLSTADGLYWAEKYGEALPLYEKLAETKSTAVCDGPLKLHRLIDLADCQAKLGHFDDARNNYLRVYKTLVARYGKNSLQIVSSLTNLAACDYYQENYKSAKSYCEKALSLLDKAPNSDPDEIAKVDLELGQIYYADAKYDDAAKNYERAIKLYDQSKSDIVEQLLLSLEGEAACFYRDKQYDKAAPILERLAAMEQTIHGKTDARYGWALMNLSDVYRKLGQREKSEPYYDKCVQIFRAVNIDRIVAEEQSKGALTPKVKAAVSNLMFGHAESGADPTTDIEAALARHRKAANRMQCLPSEKSLAKAGPWNLVSSDQIDPPVWLWMKPSVPQKAMIVCIHGLGLNARTYEAFANQLTPKGFRVLAVDVRGFGTYANSKGKEQLDFQGSFDDLTNLLCGLKSKNNSLPIFILGESMGGAIALQFTALHPELIDGLICSVPAGTRYKAKGTELKVAVRLLKAKHKPFDIGSQILSQATQKEGLKEAWENDPFNRLQLSAKELIDFQLFMDKNKSAAAKIKNRPAIFFQGGQDKLVKAKGTVEIFKEIASADKDLVVLGSSEHLIFEEGQFGPAVVFGVIGWVLAHLPDQDALAASN